MHSGMHSHREREGATAHRTQALTETQISSEVLLDTFCFRPVSCLKVVLFLFPQGLLNCVPVSQRDISADFS